jgi:hypothetical protein
VVEEIEKRKGGEAEGLNSGSRRDRTLRARVRYQTLGLGHTCWPDRTVPLIADVKQTPPRHRCTIPMDMASTVTTAASLCLAFPLLSAPSSSSSSSNTLRFPLRRRRASSPLAIAAFKKLSEASLVPIP